MNASFAPHVVDYLVKIGTGSASRGLRIVATDAANRAAKRSAKRKEKAK